MPYKRITFLNLKEMYVFLTRPPSLKGRVQVLGSKGRRRRAEEEEEDSFPKSHFKPI